MPLYPNLVLLERCTAHKRSSSFFLCHCFLFHIFLVANVHSAPAFHKQKCENKYQCKWCLCFLSSVCIWAQHTHRHIIPLLMDSFDCLLIGTHVSVRRNVCLLNMCVNDRVKAKKQFLCSFCMFSLQYSHRKPENFLHAALHCIFFRLPLPAIWKLRKQ